MADISQIKTPNGTVYNFKDATARAAIGGGMLAFIGKPSKLYSDDAGTTEVAPANFGDGNTAVKSVKLSGAVNIRGTAYAANAIYVVQTGDTMIVGDSEYVVTVSGSGNAKEVTWNEFGSTSSLGDIAFKDAGSVTFTPSGSVSISVDSAVTGGWVGVRNFDPSDSPFSDQVPPYIPSYTPSGTVSKPTLTKGTVTSTGKFTPAGSVSLTDSNKTATVAPTTGEATYTPGGSVSAPTFTGTGVYLETDNIAVPTSASFSGTEGSVSVTGTPSGTISTPTFSGSATTSTGEFTPSGSVSLTGSSTATVTVSKASSGTATYTPQGSITQPTISVSVGSGETDVVSINNPTSKTVVTDMSVSDPASGTATGELVYFSVSGETLNLHKIIETTGASISTTAKSVLLSTASITATASGAAFTGTGARLVTAALGYPTGASFSGTKGTVTVSGTPSGTVSQPTFTGSATTSTGTFTPEGTVSLTNSNKKAKVTGATPTSAKPASYTPAGSNSQPTFTGTGVRLVTGSIAVPTFASFTGTEGNVSATTSQAVTDVAAPTFTGTARQFVVEIPIGTIAQRLLPNFTGNEVSTVVSFS